MRRSSRCSARAASSIADLKRLADSIAGAQRELSKCIAGSRFLCPTHPCSITLLQPPSKEKWGGDIHARRLKACVAPFVAGRRHYREPNSVPELRLDYRESGNAEIVIQGHPNQGIWEVESARPRRCQRYDIKALETDFGMRTGEKEGVGREFGSTSDNRSTKESPCKLLVTPKGET